MIPLRDLLLLAGYKPAVERGYTFEVNLLGKAATWLLYASLGFTMVTDKGTLWPRVIFWVGFAPRPRGAGGVPLEGPAGGASVKAVVMAGGEGTRLRPLTSNQPKPMVPIVGKPCMEHILELLKSHGFDDVIVTVAFLPQAIRGYFGGGDALGIDISYSVEESPLGTAGSVRLAADQLTTSRSSSSPATRSATSTSRVSSRRTATRTPPSRSASCPSRTRSSSGSSSPTTTAAIERFLEKPSWGQVFSDTINTGIYVLEPEVLRHIPTDRPYDFAKELFPLLLEMGRPLYGCVLDGYWQDIGNLDQYRQANYDALDGKVELNIPGIQLRGNIWIGEGVELDDLDQVEGPAFVGNNCRIAPDASIGPHSVLGTNSTLRERARIERAVVESGTHIGRSAIVEGAIVGRSCDLRTHVRLHEGVAIGDEVTIGAESVIFPGVRIYPYKEVESGAQIHSSLIWESRGGSRIFGRDGVQGLINVDLTPEVALRLGIALGSALKRGARVVTSREAPAACRMVKRALHHRRALDRRGHRRPARAAVGGQPPPAEGGELRRGACTSASTRPIPRSSPIQFYERPGHPAHRRAAEGDREELHAARGAARRRGRRRHDLVSGPRRRELRGRPALEPRHRGDPRARLQDRRRLRLLGRLARPAARPGAARRRGGRRARVHNGPPHARACRRSTSRSARRRTSCARSAPRSASSSTAPPSGSTSSTSRRRDVPVDKALLLYLRLISSDGRRGRLAFPITVTSLVDRLVEGSGLEVVRTPATLADLTKAAAGDGVVFAGAVGGGYVFPEFLPAYDAVASLCKLLELLAPVQRPLSELVADLPASTLVHRQPALPVGAQGDGDAPAHRAVPRPATST